MNRFSALMVRKVRGIRVMDLMGALCLVAVVLGVYGSKARAGAEAAKIADTDRQIASETQRVQVLRALRANLARPDRLERLSEQYLAMGPVKAGRDLGEEGQAPPAGAKGAAR